MKCDCAYSPLVSPEPESLLMYDVLIAQILQELQNRDLLYLIFERRWNVTNNLYLMMIEYNFPPVIWKAHPGHIHIGKLSQQCQ